MSGGVNSSGRVTAGRPAAQASTIAPAAWSWSSSAPSRGLVRSIVAAGQRDRRRRAPAGRPARRAGSSRASIRPCVDVDDRRDLVAAGVVAPQLPRVPAARPERLGDRRDVVDREAGVGRRDLGGDRADGDRDRRPAARASSPCARVRAAADPVAAADVDAGHAGAAGHLAGGAGVRRHPAAEAHHQHDDQDEQHGAAALGLVAEAASSGPPHLFTVETGVTPVRLFRR